MKVTLTYVKNEPKISKAGKPYTRCVIKTQEHGDVWIDGFGNAATQSWQNGDIVDVEIFDDEYQGKTYKKFKTPNPKDMLREELDALTRRVEMLESRQPSAGFEEEVIKPEPKLTDFPY